MIHLLSFQKWYESITIFLIREQYLAVINKVNYNTISKYGIIV